VGSKLDLATIAGAVSGIGLLVGAIVLGGGLGLFIDVPSMLIVLGGTLAATLINYPLREVMRVMKVMPKAFSSSFESPVRTMEELLLLCKEAKKDGPLGLEKHSKGIKNRFLQSALNLVIDGVNPEQLRSSMRLQTLAMQERHKTGRKVLEGMGQWAPAFGMIGTLIGLVQMMANMSDPSTIGPRMAVALLTTFYGAVLANLIFLPMAGKLKRFSEIELMTNTIITEGIIGIQSGESPMLLENHLKSFLETGHQSMKIEEAIAAGA
jgi:chemotaxis protein MotA